MNKKKETLNVLHEKDLKEFLIRYNLYNDIQEGKILCKYCQNPILLDNICAIILSKEKIEFMCDKESCYRGRIFFQERENES